MTVELIDIDKIYDNPFNPRHYYSPEGVNDLASSIEQIGLLEVPQARRNNPEVYEVAYGGKRRRAFQKLAKKGPNWSPKLKQYVVGGKLKMPLDVQPLTDDQMAIFGLEENLKRGDLTPLDTALAVASYLDYFKDTTEEQLATKLSMTQGTVSNMRRVVKLPKEVLEKVNEGKINFTMARELCLLEGINAGGEKDDKYLMLQAVRGVGGSSYGADPATVNGIKQAIYKVVRDNFPCLDKEQGYSYEHHETLFDVGKIGCLKCDKMLKTNRTQSETAHSCTDKACWEKHQQEHKDRIAVEAKEKMAKDLAARVLKTAENISQEISAPKKKASQPEKPVPVPAPVPGLTKEEIKTLDALQAKDEVKESTDEAIFAQDRRQQLKGREADYPCLNCASIGRCSGGGVRSEIKDGKAIYVCGDQVKSVQEVTKKATFEIPKELLAKISAAAGTRTQILDLRDIRLGYYGTSDMKPGHVLLDSQLMGMSNAKECIDLCTAGFHYAFDSSRLDGNTHFVCTNPKCCSQKKAAFTREKNSRGMLRKKAEAKAIDRAVAETAGKIDIPRIKLIFLAELTGRHVASFGSGNTESTVEWLVKALKISDQFRDSYQMRNEALPKIMAALNKLPSEELAGLLVRYMLTSLTYQGDLKDYRIQTTSALNLLHIGVDVPKEALEPEKVKTGAGASAKQPAGGDPEEEEDGDDDE